jgi:hypothetical protein
MHTSVLRPTTFNAVRNTNCTEGEEIVYFSRMAADVVGGKREKFSGAMRQGGKQIQSLWNPSCNTMSIVRHTAIGHHSGHRDQDAKESSIVRGERSEFVAKRGPMHGKGTRDIVGEIVVTRAAARWRQRWQQFSATTATPIRVFCH